MIAWYQFKRRNIRRSRFAILMFWTVVPLVLVKPAAWLLYRLRFYGASHFPSQGPAILVCNHQSHLDPPFLGTFAWRRTFRALTRSTIQETYSGFWRWWLDTGYDVIWLKQGESDIGAMRAALGELKAGNVSVVFPEGSRSDDGALTPFKRGAYLLIKRSMAPVVPIAIEGSYDAWPRGTSRPRRRGRILMKAIEPIPAQTLVDMGPEGAMAHLYDVIEGLRLELRQQIRRSSRGRYPAPGPGDIDGRTLDRPKVVS